VAFLWKRDRGQTHWYDNDLERDVRAKTKWATYLDGEDGVGLSGGSAVHSMKIDAVYVYTNDTQSISDPWGREYHYISVPPYQSYKLWSDGPDGGNPADDINADVSFRSGP
jgi:hypothetical protein